jgi:hypothetical protein
LFHDLLFLQARASFVLRQSTRGGIALSSLDNPWKISNRRRWKCWWNIAIYIYCDCFLLERRIEEQTFEGSAIERRPSNGGVSERIAIGTDGLTHMAIAVRGVERGVERAAAFSIPRAMRSGYGSSRIRFE